MLKLGTVTGTMLEMRGILVSGNKRNITRSKSNIMSYSMSDWSRRVNLFSLALSASVWFLTT